LLLSTNGQGLSTPYILNSNENEMNNLDLPHPCESVTSVVQTIFNYFAVCPPTDTFCPPIQVATLNLKNHSLSGKRHGLPASPKRAKAGYAIHSEMRTISSSSSACSTQGSSNAFRPDFVKICAIRVSRSRRLPAGGNGHLQCRRHVGKCRQMSVNVGLFFRPPTP
jgi:hypothetical protein